MLTLHHMVESTCSQRVRLVLAEKELDWQSNLVPPAGLRDAAYLALNPSGVVPTLEHNGHIFIESRIICEYLEDAFPGTPLLPRKPVDRYTVRYWTKAYDDRLHLAVFVLSFLCWMRPRYLAMIDEARAVALPGLADPVKRQISQILLRDAWNSEIPAVTLRMLQVILDRLEQALIGTRWLGGECYSLGDIDMLITVQRLADLGLGMLLDERPAVAGWWDRARSRASFETGFTAWREESVLRANRERAEASAEIFAAILEGP